MNAMKFTRVIVIGFGKIAGEVLKIVDQSKGNYGYIPMYIEYEASAFPSARLYAQKENVACMQITDPKQLVRYFLNIKEKTLIISAGNYFLFPQEIVEKENLVIINFHNALLPHYPGRNAASWVIFFNEKQTGATWHYVLPEVDAGNILMQKVCPVREDEKAYTLTETLMQAAIDIFPECLQRVMNGDGGSIQKKEKNRKIYRSSEIPANGRFSLVDAGEEIYRLLRATDYGISRVFPPLITEYKGQEIKINRYKKINAQEQVEKSGYLYLPLTGEDVLQLKYVAVEK